MPQTGHRCVIPAEWLVRLGLTAVAAGLAGCAAATASTPMRYTGVLGGCGGIPATFTRVAGGFAFAPGDGSLVIRGPVAADGRFSGTLNTQPPGKPPFVLAVSGVASEQAATVSYVSPRCRADAALRPAP